MANRNLKIGPNGSNLYVGDINILGGGGACNSI